jgi:Fic family protein
MHGVSHEQLARIDHRLAVGMVGTFGLDICSLALDMTNFATTNDHAPIAQRGKTKQKRADLRLIGFGLVITRDGGIPLVSHAYPGNRPDVTQFATMIDDAVAAIEGEELAGAAIADANAVSGYRRAMTYVIGLSGDRHFAYGADLLRSLHFMMTEHVFEAWPGRYRPGLVWVRDESGGEQVYEAPDESLVPDLVEELAADLNGDSPAPAIVRAAMAHLNLVMIHPFRDGNGRMSRCLQTLVLAREQILTQELSSIEEYLGRNSSRYYDVLAKVGQGFWNPGNDALPWVRFCLEAHYVQAESVLRRLRESSQMWTEVEKLRTTAGLSERSSAALLDATIGLRVRNASYRAHLRGWEEPISNQVATTDLRAMVNAGLLIARGRNRGAYYEAAAPLLTVRGAVRAERRPIDASRLFDPDAD